MKFKTEGIITIWWRSIRGRSLIIEVRGLDSSLIENKDLMRICNPSPEREREMEYRNKFVNFTNFRRNFIALCRRENYAEYANSHRSWKYCIATKLEEMDCSLRVRPLSPGRFWIHPVTLINNRARSRWIQRGRGFDCEGGDVISRGRHGETGAEGSLWLDFPLNQTRSCFAPAGAYLIRQIAPEQFSCICAWCACKVHPSHRVCRDNGTIVSRISRGEVSKSRSPGSMLRSSARERERGRGSSKHLKMSGMFAASPLQRAKTRR